MRALSILLALYVVSPIDGHANAQPAQPVKVIEVTDATFAAEVERSTLPVVVMFWAPWCGPCRALSPTMEGLATTMEGKVSFVRVNIDDNPTTPIRFSVRTIPTVLVFKTGQAIGQVVGNKPKAEMQRLIEDALNKKQ